MEEKTKKGRGKIIANKNKKGEVISYRVRCCVGRDEHYRQIWRTCTIPRPEGLTPAKELKEVERQADAWEQEVRSEFEKHKDRLTQERLSVKNKITLIQFIDDHWMEKHVKDGSHTPDTIQFYTHMSDDIKAYFKTVNPVLKLNQIDKEDILDYLTYMRTEARTKRGTLTGKLRFNITFRHSGTFWNMRSTSTISKKIPVKRSSRETVRSVKHRR